MEQNDLEVISIIALILAVIALSILVIRWIVKRWFVGSWADKIIGGMRKSIKISNDDIANFERNCEALQTAIIVGTPITYTTMEPILNTIYLAFRTLNSVYVEHARKLSNKSRKKLGEIVTNGLKEAPLAAFIIMACPYMFTPDIRELWETTSYYQMLIEASNTLTISTDLGIKGDKNTRQKLIMEKYFDPICASIKANVSSNLTNELIRSSWSVDRKLSTLAGEFLEICENNSIGFTAANAANALREIVIPDVYEILRTNDSYKLLTIPLSAVKSLRDLPTEGEPYYKA